MILLIKQIKLCILKQTWENVNNLKRLLISLFSNCIILCWFFFRTHNNTTFIGLDFYSLLILYATIWCILMSLTLVNDIISQVNSTGIIEQIFLSSCTINRFIFIQVILKSLFSVLFISLILIAINLILHLFSYKLILSFFITLCIGIFSLLGVGYIISSISLLINYKNISLLFRLLFLIIVIRYDRNILIPFAHCKEILVTLFSTGQYIWEQELSILLGLFINSILYFVLGYFIFSKLTFKQLIIQENF